MPRVPQAYPDALPASPKPPPRESEPHGDRNLTRQRRRNLRIQQAEERKKVKRRSR